jgi:CheY-like chemotaxis protein
LQHTYILVVIMEIVDPSLLADMIFQWHHEAPFAQDGLVEALQQSDIMDSMLADMDLPEIVDMDLSVIDTPAVARASPNAGRLWPPATPHVEVSENASEVPTSRQWASAVKPTRRVGRSGMVVDAEQQEHIIRERQRRNDMGTKYLMLESLLPPAPKVYMPFT